MKDNVKILIVDDSKVYQMMMQTTLEGYNTLVAGDGLEAIEKLSEHNDIEIVVLDIHMPKMDGFEVLKHIRKRFSNRNLSVIILTNSDEIDAELKGLEEGAIDYIRKPLNGQSLLKRIDVHLNLVRTRKELDLYKRAYTELSGKDL
jgi:putative two-component system response regulator